MHLMIQPQAAATFLSSSALRDQGLLSRILVAHPRSLAGGRLYKEPSQDDVATIKAYGARLLSILETPPALAPGQRNELEPPALVISPDATAAWIAFSDHVEKQCGADLEHIKDFAAKAAEHVARIAGIITLVEDIRATEIGIEAMANAVKLMDWYLAEACRLQQGGLIDPALRRAAALLDWLQAQPDKNVAFRKILPLGPNQTAAHGWIIEASARPRIVKAVAP
jgi:Protein of unknown function (DUF3987)